MKESRVDAAHESVEIELKYEVPAGADLPEAAAFAAHGLALGATATHHLVARYFDTPTGALAAQRVAMRVREGGPDEGWHLKLKAEKGGEGTREFHWPLSASMPAGLVAQLWESFGVDASQVLPIAELRTERRTVRIEVAGSEAVEVADDLVRATQFLGSDAEGGRVDRAWREWEAELLPGAELSTLEVVGSVLEAAGATVSLSSAKIARATGTLVALAEAKGSAPETIAQLREMDRNDQAAARRLDA